MKRSVVISTGLALLFTSELFAALPTGVSGCRVNLPTLYGGFLFSITALHWETNTDHNDYALSYTFVDPINPLIFNGGIIHNVDADSRWNPLLKIGYIFPCSSKEIDISYLNYHQFTQKFFNKDAINQLILPTLSDQWPTFATVTINNELLIDSPITFNVPGDNLVIGESISMPLPTEPNAAAAKVTINHDALDLEYSQYVNLGCRTRLRIHSGLRCAKVDNELDAIYSYTAPDATLVTLPGVTPLTEVELQLSADLAQVIKQKTEYSGLGPHVGLDFRYYMRWGFGLVGDLSSSVLFGKTKTDFNENFRRTGIATVVESSILPLPVGTSFSTTTEEHENFSLDRRNRIVPNIDAKIGIDFTWLYCTRTHTVFTVEAGYMVSHYFNVVDRVSEVVLRNELNSIQTIDAHFEGLYATLQIKA